MNDRVDTNFDRAQSAYDNATPEYLDENDPCNCCGQPTEWTDVMYCDACLVRVHYHEGDPKPHSLDTGWCEHNGPWQAVCPECKGT